MATTATRLQEVLEATRSAGPETAWPTLLLVQGTPWRGEAQIVPAGEPAFWVYEYPRLRGYHARINERGIYVGAASQFAGLDVRRTEGPAAIRPSGRSTAAIARLLEAALSGGYEKIIGPREALTFYVRVPADMPDPDALIEGKKFLSLANAFIRKAYLPENVVVKARFDVPYEFCRTREGKDLVRLRLDEDRFLARR